MARQKRYCRNTYANNTVEHVIFLAVHVVLYHRKVGNSFFPELLVVSIVAGYRLDE
jgi:hypothetical protein